MEDFNILKNHADENNLYYVYLLMKILLRKLLK